MEGGVATYGDDQDAVGGVLGNRVPPCARCRSAPKLTDEQLAFFAEDSDEEYSSDEGEDDGQFESLIDKVDEIVFFVDAVDGATRYLWSHR